MIRNVALAAILVSLCVTATATDWPQYRADAARSGYTAEQLPEKLALHWVWHGEKPDRAWVGRSLARSRMQFDWIHSVAVADGRVFFGSSSEDKVYALDAATGAELWTFFTGGPVRFAPAIWEDRAGFDAALTEWQEAVAAAIAAAPASLEEAKPVAGPVFNACKGCHDNYRIEEEEH